MELSTDMKKKILFLFRAHTVAIRSYGIELNESKTKIFRIAEGQNLRNR